MPRWILDPDHTVAAFSIRHLTLAAVRGQFNQLSGYLEYDPEAPAEIALELTVAVAGLYTGIRKRDVHLVSPDFFDAVNTPEITFRGTGNKMRGRQSNLRGELTIRGVARSVTLELGLTEVFKLPPDFGGETSIGIAARTVIDRGDFGIDWNVPLGGDRWMIGNQVAITLDGEADLEVRS